MLGALLVAHRAETEFVGVPCGMMDQLASAAAPPRQGLLINCATLECSAVDVPVDLSALEGLRADGKLSVGGMQLMGLKLSELKAELRAANGRADIAPHSAKLYEGTLQGAMTLAARGNRVALKETLSGVAIGPLVKDLMGRDAVEGRGNVSVDLAAAGPTVNALKKSLAGTARIELKDGALKGINLAEALRKTRAAFGSKSAQQQPTDTAQRTDFSAMSASFVVQDGVARNDDLDVRAPLVRWDLVAPSEPARSYTRRPSPQAGQPSIFGDPRPASAESGRAFIAAALDALVTLVNNIGAAYGERR